MIFNTGVDIAVQGNSNALDIYWAPNGSDTWDTGTVAAPGTTYSAPAKVLSGGADITAAGPGGSLYDYWAPNGSPTFGVGLGSMRRVTWLPSAASAGSRTPIAAGQSARRRARPLTACGALPPTRRLGTCPAWALVYQANTAPKSHCRIDHVSDQRARAQAAPSSFDPSTSTAANLQALHAFKTE